MAETWWRFDIRAWAFLDAFFAVQDQWPQLGVNPPPPPVVNPPPVVTPPPGAITSIKGSIVQRAPNLGLSYVYGYARQPDGQPWSRKIVRFYWRDNPDQAGEVETGPDGKFSVEFPGMPVGRFDFELFDRVRTLTSPRLAVDVTREQVEIVFQAQTSAPPPPPTDEKQRLWDEAKLKQVISPNLDAALEKQATADGFAVLLSEEWGSVNAKGEPIVCQLFRDLHSTTERVYYAVQGKWDEVFHYTYQP